MNGIGQWTLVSYLIERLGVAGTPASSLITIGGVLLCIIIPYLLGSFNFGLIISKKRYNDDIRAHGSGNAGTTNMLRTYGTKAAVLTLLGDMVKAALAVTLGYLIVGTNVELLDEATGNTLRYKDQFGAAIAGLFVMLGHMFPIFYKFKGGKGVATSAMVILMISPITCLFCFIIFVIIVLGTKYVSLASIMGMIFYPILLTAFSGGQNPTACMIAVFMAVLVVFMHRENIKRLRDGKESKLSLGKKKQDPEAAEEPPAAPKVNTPNAPRTGDTTNKSKKKKRK